MEETPQRRAQIGLGTLVVFLSMILVASVAAGVLINTTGVLEAMSSDSAGTSTDRLVVVASSGSAISDGSVGRVNLTVAPGPDADVADLRNATVTWVGPRGAYGVAHVGATGADADGRFRATALSDPNDSLPVLEAGDRAILTFDLGLTDDAAGVSGFGERLRPGDVVTVTLTSGSGASTTTRLAVPRTVADRSAVAL